MLAGRSRLAVLVCALAATVGGFATAPAAVADLNSAEIVHLLSLQREANNIPGGLVERAEWSAACASHNYYEAQTGQFGHEEDPGSPYYTAEGDWAGENSVIAFGSSWSDGNPWENAPIHLLQMLAPRLSETGAAESFGHNCLTTWPGYKRPSPAMLTAYSYPGDGVSGVVPSEQARESPFIPGDFVGLPEGTVTGRYLLAYLDGLVSFAEASEVTAAATLAGPGGPVELRVIDSTSPDIGTYMPRPSAFLIPVRPLAPWTAYRASVTWTLAGAAPFEQSFSFTTGADPGQSVGPVKKRRRACGRYSRAARSARRRATSLRRRGAHLLRTAKTKAERRRGSHMLVQAKALKAKAQHRAKQAKRCQADHVQPASRAWAIAS